MPTKANRSKPKTARQRLGHFRNHPFIIPITVFMVLFFATLVGFVGFSGTTVGASDTRVITLTIDGKEQTIPTRADNVAELLKRLDISLGEKDLVSPDIDTPIESDGFRVSLFRARPVLVVDGAHRTVVYTAEPAPEAVAKAAGITVYSEDNLQETPVSTTAATDLLREGVIAEQIVITRATPATLNLYGTSVPVRTHAKTVGDLLKEKDVKLNEGDTLQPDPSTPLTADMQVFVIRVGKDIAQVEEAIESPVSYVDDFNLTLGATQVKDPGVPGKKLVTYEIDQENGVEVGRRVIQEVVVQQPTTKVISRGKKAPVVAGNKAEIMSEAGIPSGQHYAADFIISHESGWRVNAQNSRSCAGLGQACPGSKLAANCPNWQSDPVCQMRFFNSYAVNRYGSWTRAMEIWQAQRWW